MRVCESILQNAVGASYGDTIVCLDSTTLMDEVHQYKLYSGKTNVGEAEYCRGCQKAAPPKDFFILYISQEDLCNFTRPKDSAAVCQTNWHRYYGLLLEGRLCIVRGLERNRRGAGKSVALMIWVFSCV